MQHLLQTIRLALCSLLACSAVGTCFADTDSAALAADCTLTDQLSDNNMPGGAKDSFTKTTPTIYLACSFDNVRKGEILKAQWIAADTNNVAPANYKIDEKSVQVLNNLSSDEVYTTNFSLSMPKDGWPAGSYHVDLYMDDQLSQSIKFTVK